MPATVDLVQPNLAVAPGDVVATTIRLTNTGRIVDELTLEVLGDAAAYATLQPATVPLFPGARGETTLTFLPPRATSPAAGTVPYGIRVRSKEDRAFSYVVEGVLQVGAFLDVGAHLSPRTSVASRLGQSARHRIEVTNGGNTTALVRLAAADPDERLAFGIAQPILTIPPGGRAITTVSVKGRKRMLTGAQSMLPFQVSVAADGSAPQTLDGTFAQRPTLVGGTNQILTVAVVVGVVGVLATQALPLLSPAVATPSPAASLAPPTIVAGSLSTAAAATPTLEPATAAATSPPPTETIAPTATPEPSTPPPATASASATPTATAAPTPSSTPLSIRILNLGLVDPQGQVPEQTPTPEPTATASPVGGSFRPPRIFPSFPVRVFTTGAAPGSGGQLALGGPFAGAFRAALTQDQQAGLPVQQFGLQVNGPVSAQITRVSDSTTPTICLAPNGGSPDCHNDDQALAGTPSGTDPQAWFLSVTAQQGGTAVDVRIDYAPQPVTFGFKDLHLAGVSAGSGVHLVIQASSAGLIEIVTEVNIGADVTVAFRDLNTQVAAPPSTTPAGTTGAPFVAAAEPGHLYDILLTSTSPDEVFVSGTISWP